MNPASTVPTPGASGGSSTDTPSIRPLTLLFYSQDSKGMGHIVRTLTIVRRLLAAYPNAVAYIVTESPAVVNFTLPPRTDLIKMPTRLVPSGHRESKDEAKAAKHHLRDVRARILREVAVGLAPDLVLVDHEPLGYKGEFRAGLRALKAQCPETRFVFGLRDIMDDVQRIRMKWREMGVYDAFENLYDGIAVYGSRHVYDVAEAYAIPPSVISKLHYCGYIVREPTHLDAAAVRRQHGLPEDGSLVVATVGSGTDGYPVLEMLQAAVDRLQARHPDLSAILVTGPFMPEEKRAKLRARARARCRVVSGADNFQLMSAADVVVSMGGYNSVFEALCLGRPLVIVPRATHKVEQLIRAQTLAAHGLARCIHPTALTGDALPEALEWALAQDPRDHARLVREIIPSFDGVSQLTAYLSRWLGSDRTALRHVVEERPHLVQPA